MTGRPEKLYYSIGEVAKMFGVNTSLIRFWEKEFSVWLKPHRSRSGSRYFTSEDIRRLQEIYQLVKIEGYTLPGARDVLQEGKTTVKKEEKIREVLLRLRQYLTDLLDESQTPES
ncbi:MAG: MerR family transcriptional regulator [Bacteroidia bacterium]|nr:MerR family transcriptional regulator [Bacteroidia bacterium]